MKISKGNLALIVSAVIILALFNVIAFVAPFIRIGSFWVGYGFTMAAIILITATSLYAFRGDSMRSKFYGLPMPALLWSYLVIQVILGIVFMAASMIPVWISLVISLALMVIYLLGLIALNPAIEYIEKFDRKVEAKAFYIKSLQADVEIMEEKAMDAVLKKALHDLYEDIRYSDPMSSPDLAMLESKIEGKVAELSALVDEGNPEFAGALCGELRLLLSERAKKCKLLK